MNIMYPMKCMVYLCADVVYVSSLTGSKKSNTIVNFYPARYVHAVVDWFFPSCWSFQIWNYRRRTQNENEACWSRFKHWQKWANGQFRECWLSILLHTKCLSPHQADNFFAPIAPKSFVFFWGWNLDRQLFLAPLDISKSVDLIFGSPFPVNGIFFVDINIGEIVDQVRPQFPVELLSRLCKYQIYSWFIWIFRKYI